MFKRPKHKEETDWKVLLVGNTTLCGRHDPHQSSNCSTAGTDLLHNHFIEASMIIQYYTIHWHTGHPVVTSWERTEILTFYKKHNFYQVIDICFFVTDVEQKAKD